MLLKAIEQTSRYDVPVGTYKAKLTGYKAMPASPQFPDSKPSFAWEFEVLEGEHAGKVSSRFTPQNLTTANGLGKMLRELLGRNIVGGEDIDVEKLIGKPLTITVGWNKTGTKTKVILCSPVESQANASPPPPPAPPVAPPPPAPVTKQPGRMPETYQVSLAGKVSIINAVEAQKMFQEQRFTANDFILEGNTWKRPEEVLLPF